MERKFICIEIYLFRVLELEKKKEAVSNSNRRKEIKRKPEKIESSDEDDEITENIDEFLDWRSKKV